MGTGTKAAITKDKRRELVYYTAMHISLSRAGHELTDLIWIEVHTTAARRGQSDGLPASKNACLPNVHAQARKVEWLQWRTACSRCFDDAGIGPHDTCAAFLMVWRTDTRTSQAAQP